MNQTDPRIPDTLAGHERPAAAPQRGPYHVLVVEDPQPKGLS